MSALSAAAPAASDEPSVLETAFAKLKNVGIGYLMGMVRDIAKRELPEALGHRVAEQVDNLTTKFGSEPIREQVLPEWFGKDDASAHDKETDEQHSQDKGENGSRMRALAAGGAAKK